MKTEAEAGAMERLEPPESGRGRSFSESPEGAGPCPHLNFRLQASRTGRGYVSEAFNLLVCGHLLWQPQDTHTRVVHHNLHFGCGARCVQVWGTEAYRIDLAG